MRIGGIVLRIPAPVTGLDGTVIRRRIGKTVLTAILMVMRVIIGRTGPGRIGMTDLLTGETVIMTGRRERIVSGIPGNGILTGMMEAVNVSDRKEMGIA